MSGLRTPPGRALKTGGFLSFSALGDVAVLMIFGYFAAHIISSVGQLLGYGGASVVAWIAVVLAGAILLVFIPVVAGRLWSQLSTRYTTDGVSQWRFLSYRALAWPDILRVYYDSHGLVLEGQTRAIRIIANFYRRPELMLDVVHAHLCAGAAQPARALVANTCRPGASELPTAGVRARIA
jgi:hypothetical protein